MARHQSHCQGLMIAPVFVISPCRINRVQPHDDDCALVFLHDALVNTTIIQTRDSLLPPYRITGIKNLTNGELGVRSICYTRPHGARGEDAQKTAAGALIRARFSSYDQKEQQPNGLAEIALCVRQKLALCTDFALQL
jgi:hypothetical protein